MQEMMKGPDPSPSLRIHMYLNSCGLLAFMPWAPFDKFLARRQAL